MVMCVAGLDHLIVFQLLATISLHITYHFPPMDLIYSGRLPLDCRPMIGGRRHGGGGASLRKQTTCNHRQQAHLHFYWVVLSAGHSSGRFLVWHRDHVHKIVYCQYDLYLWSISFIPGNVHLDHTASSIQWWSQVKTLEINQVEPTLSRIECISWTLTGGCTNILKQPGLCQKTCRLQCSKQTCNCI